jgi:hypothetical protein
MMSSVLGTVFYSIIVFAIGTAFGRPMWDWVWAKVMKMIR